MTKAGYHWIGQVYICRTLIPVMTLIAVTPPQTGHAVTNSLKAVMIPD